VFATIKRFSLSVRVIGDEEKSSLGGSIPGGWYERRCWHWTWRRACPSLPCDLKKDQDLNSQHFIFFLFFFYLRMVPISYGKLSHPLPLHSNLLRLSVSYIENEVLWIQSQRPYQHFIFFLPLRTGQISKKEKEVLLIQTQSV